MNLLLVQKSSAIAIVANWVSPNFTTPTSAIEQQKTRKFPEFRNSSFNPRGRIRRLSRIEAREVDSSPLFLLQKSQPSLHLLDPPG